MKLPVIILENQNSVPAIFFHITYFSILLAFGFANAVIWHNYSEEKVSIRY